MLQIDSYLLASYWALLILSDVDGEMHELELEVITKFIDNSHSSNYFDKDEECKRILEFSRDDRKVIFNECVRYIAKNANLAFKNKFYSLIIDLVVADGIVMNSELELFLMAKDILGFKAKKHVFATVREIDNDIKTATQNSYIINANKTFSHESFASIELKFETLDGLLIHKIAYDNSKTNYETASEKLRDEMDKIRLLSRVISLEMIPLGVLGNKKSIHNYRFHFISSGINYFAIADIHAENAFVSYVGCSEWDYHIL